MGPELFRQAAVQGRSVPPPQGQGIQITRTRAWIGLFALGLLLLAALAWAIFGSLPAGVSAPGIIVRQGGGLNVVANGDGVLTQMHAFRAGERIYRGQIVGRIAQPALALQVRLAALDLQRLQVEQDMLEQGQQVALRDMPTVLQRAERLQAMRSRVHEARARLLVLQEREKKETEIVSAVDGEIVELLVVPGQNLRAGQAVLRLESELRLLEALLFLPPDAAGARVLPGMAVQVSPTDARRERYGYLLGRVVNVARAPASEQGMMALLNNASLVRQMSARGAPLVVTVELLPDPGTASAYRWSSPAGAVVSIHSGTLASAVVITESRSPVSLLLPAAGGNGRS